MKGGGEAGTAGRTAQPSEGLVLGLGCERGTEFAEILALAETVLSEAGYPRRPLLAIVSIDTRAREPAMLAAARHFDAAFLAFDAVRLEAETPRLATPSQIVFRHTGCHGVAEGAALAAGGKTACLLVQKRRSAHATAAVAMVDDALFQSVAHGSSRGESTGSHGDSRREPGFAPAPSSPLEDRPAGDRQAASSQPRPSGEPR